MKLTVIIPVYNQEDLVIRALDSIPKRDDIEIIVIDDKSTDDTWVNLLKYAERNIDIILLYNEENKGVGYTVNKGLDSATGDYVVLLGADDYFYTKEFEKALVELDGTDIVYFNLKSNDDYVWDLREETKRIYCGSTKFIRREFLGDTRNPEIRVEEDKIFYEELLKKKPTEKFTHKIVKHYNYPRKDSLTEMKQREKIPLFSVIIPNYNSEKWIINLMNSIKRQTFKDYEIIVVDDISTDYSLNILANYCDDASLMGKFNLYRNKYKRYNGGTRNAGVEKAKGKYILFIDCDDYFYRDDAFETIANIIQKENNPDLVRLPYHYLVKRGEGDVMLTESTPRELMTTVFVAPWTKCIKRELFVPFPENTLIEDVSQHIEQIDKIETIALCPIPICVWNCRNEKAISNPQQETKSIKRLASWWYIIGNLMELEGKLEHDYSEEHRLWRLNNYKQIAKEKLNGM